MEKVVNFLEKHVQWIALGLAAVVLLFMTWTYVVQAPVTVSVEGKTLTPGEIDEATVKGPVAQYSLKKNVPPNLDPFITPDFVKPFQQKFNPAETAVALFDKIAADRYLAADYVPGSDTTFVRDTGGGPKVKELPTLVAATWSAGNNGRSVVMVPDLAAMKAAAAKGGNVAAVAAKEVDKDWVTQKFEIDTKKLAAEFRKVFEKYNDLPPNVYETMVVHVELHRQEKLPNGQWGNETIVKPLANTDQPPFPEDQSKNLKAVVEYADWVNTHADKIS